MNTIERLQQYNPGFSDSTLATVERTIGQISRLKTYQEVFEQVGLGESEQICSTDGRMTEVVDVLPDDCDTSEALMVHLAMAQPLDSNQKFGLSVIAASLPNTRIISYGNRSTNKRPGGNLKLSEQKQVVSGNLTPVVEPVLWHAETSGVENTIQTGGSLGAELATTASRHIATTDLVVTEPVAVKKRMVIPFGLAFAGTGKHLDRYVEASGLDTFKAARKDSVGMSEFGVSLTKATNLAIVKAMAQGTFEENLQAAYAANPNMYTTVAFGTESELCERALIEGVIDRAKARRGTYHVMGMPIEGQTHAMMNDLALNTAVLLEGLAASNKSQSEQP